MIYSNQTKEDETIVGGVYSPQKIPAKTFSNSEVEETPIKITPPLQDNQKMLTASGEISDISTKIAGQQSNIQVPLVKTYIANEDLSKGDAVRISPLAFSTSIYADTGGQSEWDGSASGSGSPFQAVAVKYVPSGTKKYNKITTRLLKVNSPTDNIFLEIRETTADGTLLATSDNTVGSTLTASFANYTFTFPNVFQLTDATIYYVVFNRSTSDTVNYYAVENGATSGGAGDTFGQKNAGVWSYTNLPRPNITVIFNDGVDSGVKKAKAITQAEADLFLGFCKENTINGFLAEVILQGEVVGLSLTGPSNGQMQFYLSDTAGQISITAGTISRKVGIATSASTLLVTNIW